jgi:UDP-glucose 4-epimerase
LILIGGAGGFIGRALASALPEARAIGHTGSDAPGLLQGIAVAVWCGRDPRLGTAGWALDDDAEIAVAKRCAKAGVHLLSLGTRKVYAPSPTPLDETAPVGPTDLYGRQKLALEEALAEILGAGLTRLRLANVFGFEPGRRSFMGRMLTTLAAAGEVRFAMSPFTRRDFLPVDAAAAMLAALARDPPGGIVNLGSGIALEAGRLAQALMEGFGRGRLVVERPEVRDAFVLDTSRLHRLTGLAVEAEELLAAARRCGRRLAEVAGRLS